MPEFLPADTGKDFELPPTGTHPAICYRIIDMGTQQVEFQGAVKYQRKVLISWELAHEKMADGRPFTISKKYTWSTHEKAALRKDLESWRGRKFGAEDFGLGGFSMKKLLGVPALLGVVHNFNNGREYANIVAVLAAAKGQVTHKATNPLLFFDLEKFDRVVFDSLSDGMKAAIMKAPEYAAALNGGEPPVEYDGPDDDHNAAPF